MYKVGQASEAILKELISDDTDVRGKYLKLFEKDVKTFADSMAHAFLRWRSFDNKEEGDEKRQYVSTLVFTALNLHILSLKLLLSGHIVAAGNLFRQVIECISLALLCSSKDIDILARFMEDKYSSSKAVRDVLRKRDKLSLKGEALKVMEKSEEFYHKYSHVTKMTLATVMSFSKEGELYLCALFDEGKV